MQITVGVPTKDRYDSLAHTLVSIALQSLPPAQVIIVDDSTDRPIEITSIPMFQHILQLFEYKKIKWEVLWGAKKGQHVSHQIIQDRAVGDFVFRIDDDCIAEQNVLECLANVIKTDTMIGAVAPLVLMPNPSPVPVGLKNSINDLTQPNVQWFTGTLKQEADHLYSCFLYKKGIAKYEDDLSPVSHREETFFTYKMKLAGYKLIVAPDSQVWHFRAAAGGIRTGTHHFMWEHDEKKFQEFLSKNSVVPINRKYIVMDNGMGDHFAFKNILPELQKKYEKITIAACYPDVFFDIKGLELISIADAKMRGNIDEYNVYRKMIDWNWKDSLVKAFEKLYL